MSEPVPPIVFGLAPREHRVLRVRALLTHYNVRFPTPATKNLLLMLLRTIEGQMSDRESAVIARWLRGGGLLSDLRPTLRRAQILDKQVQVEVPAEEPSPEAVPETVPVSEEQECNVCLIIYPGDAFPRKRLSVNCKHTLRTCSDCLQQSLDIQIRDKPWDQIVCTECPAKIPHRTVKDYASPEAFDKYDQKHLFAILQAMPDFIMCSSPTCGSGQFHPCGNKEPIMKCIVCESQTCVTHKMPWHTDFTCKEYDALHAARKEQEKASSEYLQTKSKICPNSKCGLHVQKVDGCDHISCTYCNHEFCWACRASYDAIRSEGNSAHTRNCKHYFPIAGRRPARRPVVPPVVVIPPRRRVAVVGPPPAPRPQPTRPRPAPPVQERRPLWVGTGNARTAQV